MNHKPTAPGVTARSGGATAFRNCWGQPSGNCLGDRPSEKDRFTQRSVLGNRRGNWESNVRHCMTGEDRTERRNEGRRVNGGEREGGRQTDRQTETETHRERQTDTERDGTVSLPHLSQVNDRHRPIN